MGLAHSALRNRHSGRSLEPRTMAAATKRKTSANRETSLRHVWLASLGLAVLARRQALATGHLVAGRADGLKRRAIALADDARANVVGGLDLVRGQVEPKV